MSNYGRNFGFRISPPPDQRRGRYITPADVVIPIGAPVRVPAGAGGAANLDGRTPVALATGASAPVSGITGIAVFEHAYNAFAGLDPVLAQAGDFGDIPAGSPIQLVSGTEVKVWWRNTTDADFEFLSGGAPIVGVAQPRVFLGPADLTGWDVGDLVRPGAGNDTAGYWALAAGAEAGWFVVTLVDTTRGLVEAQMVF